MRNSSSRAAALAVTTLIMVLALAGFSFATNYTSVASGNWNDTMTWSPRGIPDSMDNVTISGYRVALAQAQNVDTLTIASGGKFVAAANNFQVYGDWVNNGADSLTSSVSIVTFRGRTSAAIRGNTTTNFNRLYLKKTSGLGYGDTIYKLTQQQNVVVYYGGGSATPSLYDSSGTFVTNGYNLTVNGANAYITGADYGARIDVTTGGTVTLNYLYQWNLHYFRVSGNPTVNIYRQDVANGGHRTDILGGTVNYTSTGAVYNLQLYTNNSGWGWFATAGDIYFNGSIGPGNISTYFQASGTAVVHFVGSANSNVNLIGWASVYANYWDFNDLRIEKSGNAVVNFQHTNTGPLSIPVTAKLGVTVNSGAGLALRGLFNPGIGYIVAGMLNNGTLVDSQNVYCLKSWINHGSFTGLSGNVIMDSTGSDSIVPNHGQFCGLVANKVSPGNVTITDSLAVNRSLEVRRGNLVLSQHNLTLGTTAVACSVRMSGGTLQLVGASGNPIAVTAASASYPWAFRDSAGTIQPRYVNFSYPDSFGLRVEAGGLVDAAYKFNNCTFEHGSIPGPMLRIENSQSLDTIRFLSFNATAGRNIAKLANSGHITVDSSGHGTRWGPDYEIDPNSRVDWIGPDVGVWSLVAPLGPIDSGGSVTPACSVYNWGSSIATYPVRCRIGAAYDSTVTVTGHTPGTKQYVTFPAWTPMPRGGLAVSCSTQLAVDLRRANDKMTGLVFVNAHDVAATALKVPAGIDSGATVTPACSLYNRGNVSEGPYSVLVKIGAGYSNTASVTIHAAGTYVYVTFPAWTAAVRGANPASCSTQLAVDGNRNNDKITGSVNVAVHDIGAVAIIAPTGAIPPGATIPQASVHNYGTAREASTVTFRINSATPYMQTLTLAGGLPFADTVLSFPSWTAVAGSYVAKCSTRLANDQVPANNVLTHNFSVVAPDTGWVRLTDVPLGAKSKRVKDGGCLAAYTSGDTDYVYALKGNGRCEFYLYNSLTNAWTTKESIPATGSTGKKKAVKKGSFEVYTDKIWNQVFAGKGNSTLEFYAYHPRSETTPGYWQPRADIPIGGKTLKEGAGAAAVQRGDTSFVYLLKGSNTTEFYRYDIAGNTWSTLANAPTGLSGKAYKNGSAICASDDGLTIFALKGSYNEMYAYSCSTNTWVTKTSMPLVGTSGKKKKVKDGAGMAYHNHYVYALKGDNTKEFWAYQADSDKWTQTTDIPIGSGKNVKGGGALCAAGMRLYAFKGNNTLDFFKFGFAAFADVLSPANSSNVQSNAAFVSRHLTLAVSPNPFTSATTISYSLPEAGNVSLKLYDVAGKLVTTLATGCHNAGTSSFVVSRSSFSAGIYLLKLETRNSGLKTQVATSKLIIE